MESQTKKAGLTPGVIKLVERLQGEEAQGWCDELSIIIDRIILMDNGEDPASTLDSLKTLQTIKAIFKQFTQ